jgi:antitoxin (DNA-binding transcriptional repressor) of toxin-antitoxin stability system
MSMVTWQELRDRTDAILARVGAGDAVVISADGRPIASLQPIGPGRPVYGA